MLTSRPVRDQSPRSLRGSGRTPLGGSLLKGGLPPAPPLDDPLGVLGLRRQAGGCAGWAAGFPRRRLPRGGLRPLPLTPTRSFLKGGLPPTPPLDDPLGVLGLRWQAGGCAGWAAGFPRRRLPRSVVSRGGRLRPDAPSGRGGRRRSSGRGAQCITSNCYRATFPLHHKSVTQFDALDRAAAEPPHARSGAAPDLRRSRTWSRSFSRSRRRAAGFSFRSASPCSARCSARGRRLRAGACTASATRRSGASRSAPCASC